MPKKRAVKKKAEMPIIGLGPHDKYRLQIASDLLKEIIKSKDPIHQYEVIDLVTCGLQLTARRMKGER